MAMDDIKKGIYQHYKWKLYEVIWLAWSSIDCTQVVIYRALYRSQKFGDFALWTRPKEEFFGTELVDGISVPRFVYIWEKN
jgi:hypothetical protein